MSLPRAMVPVLVACLACGAEPAKKVEAPAPAPIDFSSLDAAMDQFLSAKKLPGATLAVVHRERGLVHERGYGAFDAGRVMLVASSSKTVSAGVLLRLADQGVVDLDKPISTYLGAWGQFKTDITLAQMLSNSAGMVGLLDDPTYGRYVCQYLWVSTLQDCGQAIYTAGDAMERVPPDTRFRYGGGQWQLAGAVAEVASGKRWADLVEETYRKPCGLGTFGYTNQFADAFDPNDASAAMRYPTFFHGDVADLPVTTNPNIEGGLYATARDYGQLLLMELRGGTCAGGRVLSEAAVKRMQTDRIGPAYDGVTPDPLMPGYGLGWWASRLEPGYVSDAGAYGAMPWLDTKRGYGVMLIIESDATTGIVARETLKPILDEIFDGLPKT